MKLDLKIILLPLLCLALCSYTGYKKCVPCAKSDLKGKIKKLIEVELDGEEQKDKMVYLYDESGMLTEERDTTWKKYEGETAMELASVTHRKYFYKDGRLQRVETHVGTDGDNKTDRLTDYTYDEKGREISVLEYFKSEKYSDGAIRTETSYEHDGTAIKKKFTKNKKGVFEEEVGQRLKEIYNANGFLTEIWEYNKDSAAYLPVVLRRPDAQGNMAESKRRDKIGLGRSRGFQFDKDGKLIAEVHELPTGLSQGYTYTYSEPDSRGNFLKIVSSLGIVTTREIEYYP